MSSMLRPCCCFLLVAGLDGLEFAHRSSVGSDGNMLVAGLVAAAQNSSRAHVRTLHDFVREFSRDYVPGTEEWGSREETFRSNLERLAKFQSIPGMSWTPGVTKFMDYTHSEYTRLMGYKGRRSKNTRNAQSSVSNKPVAQLQSTRLPPVFSLLGAHSINMIIRDQGGCGSCWAESATSALEGAVMRNPQLLSQITGIASHFRTSQPTLSAQSMVSCTQNPQHCGGTGGCEGATAELAYAMVKSRGLPLAVSWPYKSGSTGKSGKCDPASFASQGPRIGISGFTVLPKNKFPPLKNALVSGGAPIVVSVDASNWNFYSSGIFSDTQFGKGDFTVSHAVTLMGYADPSANAMGYWHIKNSWGENFGERGFIRLEMKQNEESHCGWDEDTHVGIACDGDPNRDWVCGTCGILYDSSLPTEPYIMG